MVSSASCEVGGGGFDPIETCPTLAAGRNEGFPSADEARKFELVLPSEYGTDRSWPLVFAYHGLGQNIDQMLDSGLREMADSFGVILAVPEGLDFGGSPGWDAVNTEAINKDLQLFDDMLTCVTAQYDIDRDRVFVTCMSNRGHMAAAQMAPRSTDIAAAAPISGGVITEWPAEAVAVPTSSPGAAWTTRPRAGLPPALPRPHRRVRGPGALPCEVRPRPRA